jgi:hypothetical protein
MTDAEIKELFPTRAHWELERRRLLAEGRLDALSFALYKCRADLDALQKEIAATEDLIADLLDGPMKPGAHPRYYRDGYLAGLNEAVETISSFDDSYPSAESSNTSRQEMIVADDEDETHHENTSLTSTQSE